MTYGATVLLAEKENVHRHQMLYLSVFLLFAHGLLEESVIFALIGASIGIVFGVRITLALFFVVCFHVMSKFFNKADLAVVRKK